MIVAEQQTDGNFQWAWSADDAVWIVRGKRDAENYVRALLQLHAPTLDPYDQQGMTGDLFDHTPPTAGYQYWDFTRDTTLDSLGATGFGDCAERFYLGYILPDGVTAEVVDNNLLWLGLEKAAGRCVEDGLLEEVGADIAAGRQAEQIGGVTVTATSSSPRPSSATFWSTSTRPTRRRTSTWHRSSSSSLPASRVDIVRWFRTEANTGRRYSGRNSSVCAPSDRIHVRQRVEQQEPLLTV